MLVEFAVENYMSLNALTRLSMLSSRESSFPDHCLPLSSAGGKARVNKLAVLFGPNAGGKSNLLNAFGIMRRMALSRGIQQADEDGEAFEQFYKPFHFVKERRTAPTLFQAVYEVDAVCYRYGFRYTSEKVVDEWLYTGFGSVEKRIFFRSGLNIECCGKWTIFQSEGAKFLTPRNLLLNICAQAKVATAVQALKFFSSLRTTSPVGMPLGLLFKDEVFLPALTVMLRYADIGVQGIDCREEDVNISDPPERMEETSPEFYKALKTLVAVSRKDTPKQNAVHFCHAAGHADLAPDDRLLHEKDESGGTLRFLRLLHGLCRAFSSDGIIFIDEIERGLHPLLTAGLLKFFTAVTDVRAQLICSSHCASLFSNDILRRDELCLVEKDECGQSSIQCVADFAASRSDGNLLRRYMDGRFGGVPQLRDDILEKGSQETARILADIRVREGKVKSGLDIKKKG